MSDLDDFWSKFVGKSTRSNDFFRATQNSSKIITVEERVALPIELAGQGGIPWFISVRGGAEAFPNFSPSPDFEKSCAYEKTLPERLSELIYEWFAHVHNVAARRLGFGGKGWKLYTGDNRHYQPSDLIWRKKRIGTLGPFATKILAKSQ